MRGGGAGASFVASCASAGDAVASAIAMAPASGQRRQIAIDVRMVILPGRDFAEPLAHGCWNIMPACREGDMTIARHTHASASPRDHEQNRVGQIIPGTGE